jgi:bacillolysin
MVRRSEAWLRAAGFLTAVVLLAFVFFERPSSAQAGRSLAIAAAGAGLPAWMPRVDGMLRDGTLDLASAQDDTMIAGRRHERLAQYYRGVPVFGGQVARQMDGRAVVSLSGRLYEGMEFDVTPSLDSVAAARIAMRDAGDDSVVRGEPVLGVMPTADGGYVLAYRLEVRSALDIRIYYVNARSGAIAGSFSRLEAQGPSVGRGTGVLGDTKKVSASAIAGTFQAADGLRPAEAFILDFKGSATRLNAFLATGIPFTSDIAVDGDNVWTDGAVVDAHVYQGWVYDYYYKRFGRRGLDDRNLQVIGIVHPLARADYAAYTPETRNTFINNALYIGDGFMIYGDGDGRVFNFLAGALDVVGHELAHGVIDYSSQLEYQDESGALSEAFSDIMGTSLEFFQQPVGSGPQRADWMIAEDVTLVSPGYLRSLNNPSAVGDPDHYSLRRFIGTGEDNGGVHFNCTIADHAFYLAVAGGRNRVSGITVAGVGVANMEKIERIFYRAFVFFLGPHSRFSDARAATLQAAADLFGVNSNERAQVQQAWTAVGVN